MVKYILKRLVQLVVVLLGVTFLTFMITQAAPSDAAEMKYVSMGMMPSSELLEKTREEMGLNDPALQRLCTSAGDGVGTLERPGSGRGRRTEEQLLHRRGRKILSVAVCGGFGRSANGECIERDHWTSGDAA